MTAKMAIHRGYSGSNGSVNAGPRNSNTEDMGDNVMPHFMLRFRFAQSSVKAMTTAPSDRAAAAVAALAPLGAKLKDYYFSFGDFDSVVIYEAPSAISAAALAMTLGSAGSMTDCQTTQLLTMAEAMEAMKLSGTTQGAYKPASA